ncbi:helix-turn-helix domain-containing protein [Alkalihalobacillus oceani]|uniref:Helix-turn-helix domain-containing protein n=1 Tax=Halalkalibacter oceani TaxID=1653776 RepID=A0A9X2IRN6_9BACI|nr:helix-turn-helix domain-containing protein [Halalkalibacter oceani]MCM3716632.1 helix-turn-helix domain-containing protein [Halalkalibacter oceani]
MTEQTYYRIKDLADITNCSEAQIRYLLKENKIKAINAETWKLEGGYLFDKHALEAIKEKIKAGKGVTTRKAAEALGVSVATVLNYIRNGQLKATKQIDRGREKYMISEEELSTFSKSYSPTYQQTDRAPVRTPKHSRYLFQPFKNSVNGEMARVYSLSTHPEEQVAIGEQSQRIRLNELLKQYKPLKQMEWTQQFLQRKGDITFSFPLQHPRSSIYTLIDYIYNAIGLENCKARIKDDIVSFTCKPFQLRLDQITEGFIQTIESSMVSGRIIKGARSFQVIGETESIQSTLHYKNKEKLINLAKENDMSLEKFVKQILEDYLTTKNE